MSEVGKVNSLLAELSTQGRAKANNVAKLLAIMSSCKQEGALKSVIQGLKVFFVAAGQDGELSASSGRQAKRQKLAAGAAGAVEGAAPAADPEAQYRDWLGRQYGNYVNQMLEIATGAPAARQDAQPAQPAPQPALRSAGLQVCAAAALMECVRSEGGPGSFSGSLYGRLLAGVLAGRGVRPEVFSLLFTKYFGMADVRYFTLVTVRAVAARHGSAPAAAEGEEDEDAGAAAEASAAVERSMGAGSTSSSPASAASPTLPLPDIARNAYDVLAALPEALPGDVAEWSSWCGAVEYNAVAAAPDKNESAKARRKRKQAEQGSAVEADGSQPAQRPQQQAQWANPRTQRRLFGGAWLALLRLPLPRDVLRKALVRLPVSVMPHMNSPAHLADFFTHALNRGGLTGMLALNGLFVLVTRHGLEYPQFFERLYQLLVPEAFLSRSRGQFFRLADIFLSSPLVPAYTVAAFVKRFARLALAAPPAGCMVAIAFIHNLIRRHPALGVMLHNPRGGSRAGGADANGDGEPELEADGGDEVANGGGRGGCPDPYDPTQPDPAKSRAVESSLWEVEALRCHYCPQVSTFCAVLDKDLTNRTKTAEVAMEELLGGGGGRGGAGSYSDLIEGELSRKLRHVASAFYAQPPAGLWDPALDGEDWGGWDLGLGSAADGEGK